MLSISVYGQCPTLTIINKQNVSCFGGANGQVTVQITPDGSLPPCGSGYNIVWSNGANTSTISGLTAGVYYVNVTNNCTGCTSFAIASIDEPYQLTTSSTKTDANCKSQASGTIDLEVSGGTPPYTYSWNNGSMSQDLLNILAGNYNVTVTDDNGCTTTNSAVVNEPAAAVANTATVNDVSCFLGNDGAILLDVFGGTPPYTYSWNSGTYVSEDISNLTQGPYAVDITDAKGCVLTKSYTVQQPTAISTTLIPSAVLCNGTSTGAISLSTSGGTSPYAYSWSSSNFTLGNSQNLVNIPSGNYYLEVTDNLGCIHIDSAEVTEPSILLVTSTVSHVSCNGFSDGNIQLTTSGGTPPYTYTWSDGNGALPNTTEDLINIPSETYEVLVEDFNGCSFSQSFTITQPPAPISISSTKLDVDCFGNNTGSIDLTVVGGTFPYQYSWAHGPSSQDVEDLFFGNYTVTVIDTNGCIETENVFVDQPSNPLTVNANITPAACYDSTNGSIELSPSGGTVPYSYQWINSTYALSATTKDLTGMGADWYAVTITDSNLCQLSDTFTINQPNQLMLSLAPTDVLCYGESTGSIDLTINGGTIPYNFLWSNSEITEDIQNLSIGKYYVTITDNNGCIIEDSSIINQPLAPLSSTYNIKNVTCHSGNDGHIIYTVSGGTPNYTYSWSNGGQQKDIFNVSAGSYQIVTTDDNQCQLVDTILVSEPDFISVLATITPVRCKGESSGEIDITVTGGTPEYDYHWTNSDFVLSASTQDLIELPADSYSVEVTDTNGCTGSSAFIVTEPDELTINGIKTDVTCFGAQDGTVTLNPTGGNPSYTYDWNNGSSQSNLINLGPGAYIISLTDTKGCNVIETFTIYEPDEISLNPIVTEVSCKDQADGSIQLYPQGGNGAYTYNWDFGSASSYVDGLAVGNYYVVVTDILGCTGDSTIEMTINPRACIDIPNAFSPNGDGINDTWIIDNLFLYEDAKLNIYNEWGNLVFQGENDSEWDGTYNGNTLPNGTYYYILKVLNDNETYKGGVTIIR